MLGRARWEHEDLWGIPVSQGAMPFKGRLIRRNGSDPDPIGTKLPDEF